ncbi:putative exosome complex exonuclease Rrp45 [Mitosporidium daphniae]|uniref:Putative exosome complex exonuclease Rrp45 n=1 Tax=Mitosporidium daphniae TaxID=1485682 RepID=A0A098VUG7_9MICR|nr:putative exosome complex exonuclease Rrp45 [Mitosporidium daphniae]KGG52622.1 putative exosome complex exonuclease Rrp45 [Mitosporidium daphniae]|eukprot:XP_013239084.1 putative exosome complex exonuclease Rrp45 [Mitosporidium daphniae]
MSLTLNVDGSGNANHLQAKFLAMSTLSNVRVDGRNFTESRIPTISSIIPTRDSISVELTLGATRVHTALSFESGSPNPERPKEGSFSLKLNSLPSLFDKPSTGELESHFYIHRLLETVYKFSKAIDLERLCIRSGEQVWNLCASITILDCSDGNVIGCSSYSLLCALFSVEMYNRLCTFKYPDVALSYTPPDEDLLKNSKLNLNNIRPCMLIDPCQLEEIHCVGDIIVSIDPNTKDVFSVYKRGLSMPAFEITRFIEKHSISVAKTIISALRNQLSQHINKL